MALAPHFLCWVLGIVAFNTWLISIYNINIKYLFARLIYNDFGYVCNPVTVVTTWDVEPRKLSLNLSNHQYATTLAVWKYVWHTFMDGIPQKLTVQWISFSWWICNVSFFVKTQRYAFLLWLIFEKGAQKDRLLW